MTSAQFGIAVGAVLALTAVAFGFWEMVLVALAMAIGAVIARVIAGDLDIARIADAFRGKRTSS